MLLSAYKQYFAQILQKETNLSLEEILPMIEIPPENIPGDFAFPCFQLSKTLKKAPNAISQELAQKLTSEYFYHFESLG
jgi:arginyl-tRNA synthetase